MYRYPHNTLHAKRPPRNHLNGARSTVLIPAARLLWLASAAVAIVRVTVAMGGVYCVRPVHWVREMICPDVQDASYGPLVASAPMGSLESRYVGRPKTHVVVATAIMLDAPVTFVPLGEHNSVIFLNHPFAIPALMSVRPLNSCCPVGTAGRVVPFAEPIGRSPPALVSALTTPRVFSAVPFATMQLRHPLSWLKLAWLHMLLHGSAPTAVPLGKVLCRKQ